MLLGIAVAPIFWLLQKLGVTKAPPALSPPFDALSAHLYKNGLAALGEMQQITVANVKEMASFRLGFDPAKFQIVTITLSPDENAAATVEAEAKNAPQFTQVCRNGCFVMACTFSPPDPELEKRFAAAFGSFKHGV